MFFSQQELREGEKARHHQILQVFLVISLFSFFLSCSSTFVLLSVLFFFFNLSLCQVLSVLFSLCHFVLPSLCSFVLFSSVTFVSFVSLFPCFPVFIVPFLLISSISIVLFCFVHVALRLLLIPQFEP